MSETRDPVDDVIEVVDRMIDRRFGPCPHDVVSRVVDDAIRNAFRVMLQTCDAHEVEQLTVEYAKTMANRRADMTER